jgi:hypothetical protein
MNMATDETRSNGPHHSTSSPADHEEILTKEELYDMEYCIDNTINDIKDYCKDEDNEEQLNRLEELHAKVQGMLKKLNNQS